MFILIEISGGWSILYIEGSQVIISKKNIAFLYLEIEFCGHWWNDTCGISSGSFLFANGFFLSLYSLTPSRAKNIVDIFLLTLMKWHSIRLYQFIVFQKVTVYVPSWALSAGAHCTLRVAGWKPTSNHILIAVGFFNLHKGWLSLHRGHGLQARHVFAFTRNIQVHCLLVSSADNILLYSDCLTLWWYS